MPRCAALDDQQLAGLLMIAACPLSYLVAAVVITVQLIAGSMRQPRRCCASRCDSAASRCASICPRATRRIDQARTLRRRRDRCLLGFSVPVVRRLQRRGKPRALGHHRMAPDLRDAQLGEDARARHRGAAARQRRSRRRSAPAHFHSGCAFCHGAPGMPISPIAQGMLPPPPDLATQMRPWRDRELFWIVKNGIKYTGMPAWAAQQRDDEVWALVAFLRRLPALDAARLSRSRARRAADPAAERTRDRDDRRPPRLPSAPARAATAPSATAPTSALVPILHGQPVEFLDRRACTTMRAGAAPSGIMQPVASDLAPRGAAIVSRATTPGCRPPPPDGRRD